MSESLKVYVVYQYDDYTKGGNNSKVVGVYKIRKDGEIVMKASAEDYINKNLFWSMGSHTKNFVNITNGEDYKVFVIEKSYLY